MQSEEVMEARQERDVLETDTFLSLVGVQQPPVLYRVDLHRWATYPPPAKLQPSVSRATSCNEGTKNITDEDAPAKSRDGSVHAAGDPAQASPTQV